MEYVLIARRKQDIITVSTILQAWEIKVLPSRNLYSQEGNEKERAITYRADFIVFHNDGTVEIVDVKGYESQN